MKLLKSIKIWTVILATLLLIFIVHRCTDALNYSKSFRGRYALSEKVSRLYIDGRMFEPRLSTEQSQRKFINLIGDLDIREIHCFEISGKGIESNIKDGFGFDVFKIEEFSSVRKVSC